MIYTMLFSWITQITLHGLILVNSQSLYPDDGVNYLPPPLPPLEDAPHLLPPHHSPSYVTSHDVVIHPEHPSGPYPPPPAYSGPEQEHSGPYHAPPPPPKSYGPPPPYSSECALIVPSKRAAGPPLKPLSSGLRYINNYVAGGKKRARRSTTYPAPPQYPVEGNICITFDDINRAVYKAKKKLGAFIPDQVYELSSDFPKPIHIAVPAEIMEEATRLLAEWFGLSIHTILYLLPRVDTTRTAARDICPTFLMPVKCELSKYRTLTGMCNNLLYPSWGASRTAMIRYLPPAFADGISVPTRSVADGLHLPSARLVSFMLHHDISHRDPHVTMLMVTMGQIIDHDMTFASSTRSPFGGELECCGKPFVERHPNCLPIEIPKDDPFFKYFKRTCMEFNRVLPSLKPGCPLGPRSPANTISAFIDCNFVYGSTQEVATRLRELKGGRMKTSGFYRNLGLKDLLPINTHDPDHGCERRGHPKNAFCFDAGDERVNEQIALTAMHTLWLREHNKIADYLYNAYPSWSDETLYQETRRIIVAQFQHVVFNEWLPVILGRKVMNRYGLDLVEDGYYNGYDEKVNPSIRLAFQAAAFRFGHSILPDVIERFDKYHRKIEAIRLSVLLRQPYELYKPGILDSFVLGMLNQEAARMDPEVTTEVTNHLFERPGSHFGRDLAAINIQRGRELGLPPYNAFREYCGLPKFRDFYDMYGSFDNITVRRFQSLYKSVDDIELWSAGISEYPNPGALLGPTFSCIIAEQFSNVRRGDRFWYENYNKDSYFTPEQLRELRKVKMARLICDNADDLETIQLFPFLTADPHTNPRVACRDLPYMDLSKFLDTPGYGPNYISSASSASVSASSGAAAASSASGAASSSSAASSSAAAAKSSSAASS